MHNGKRLGEGWQPAEQARYVQKPKTERSVERGLVKGGNQLNKRAMCNNLRLSAQWKEALLKGVNQLNKRTVCKNLGLKAQWKEAW